MLAFIASYLVYNLLAGIVLSVIYYRTEGFIVDEREFLWILLFPAVGLGKWRYEQKVRSSEELEFPKTWYVWKYMMNVHWGYIISVGIIAFIALILFGGLFGSGTASAKDSIGVGFGMLADLGILLLLFLFTIITALGLAFLFLILIFIPKNNMKSIEANIYRQKYLDESKKNIQNNNPSK